MGLKAIYRTCIFTVFFCAILAEKSFTQSLTTFRENKADSPEHPRNRNYSKVDSFVTTWLWNQEEYTSMEMLADTIKNNFSDEADRVRAIFMWMTENIAYDCEKYHSKKRPQFKITSKRKERPKDFKKRWKAELEKWDREQAKQCFEKKKGVCEDYALLFKYLCSRVGIESEVVSGYVNDPYTPNRYLGRHAWNKVKIDGKWYLVDVTWACGYADRKVTKFTKEFNEKYFLPEPEEIANTHFEKTK